MTPNDQIDPRQWSGEIAQNELASIIRLELERARVEAVPPPPPPSPWTPTVIGTLLTTVGGIITAIIMAAVQLAGSGAREDERTRTEIKAAIDVHAEVESKARDEITQRLAEAEARATWAASGVCALNGAPLHVTQPAECTAVVQRDPVKVPNAYR